MYQQARRNSQTNSQEQESANPFSFAPSSSFGQLEQISLHDRNIAESSRQDSLYNVNWQELWKQDWPPHINIYENRVIRGYNEQAMQALSVWASKIDEYKRGIGEPSDNNDQGRKDKLEKCEIMLDRVFEEVETEQATFRGLLDYSNVLQAAAIVKNRGTHLEVEEIVTAPWNILQDKQESVKGAGTALMEELTKESAELHFEGRLRLIPISDTQEFYEKIGFEETDREDWELTSEAAKKFLERQENRRLAMPM